MGLRRKSQAIDHQQCAWCIARVQTAKVDVSLPLEVCAGICGDGTGLHIGCGHCAEEIGCGVGPRYAQKSCGLRLVTGTPTAAVPRMSEPVTSTCSGTSSGVACAICACATCWACAAIAPAIVSKEAEPKSAASFGCFFGSQGPSLKNERFAVRKPMAIRAATGISMTQKV